MGDLVNGHGRFVGVEQPFLGQDFLQALVKGLQCVVLLLASSLQGAFTDGKAEHLLTHLANASAGSYFGLVEVREQREKVLSVLDRGFDVGRKLSPTGLPAAAAVYDFGLMLGAFQSQRG